MTRELEAYINERPIGLLREDSDVWAFDYAPDWVHDPAGFDLSPALPRAAKTLVDGFAGVSRAVLVETGRMLGLARATAARELARLIGAIGPAARRLVEDVERENRSLPEAARMHVAREMRLLRAIDAVVIRDMLDRLR